MLVSAIPLVLRGGGQFVTFSILSSLSSVSSATDLLAVSLSFLACSMLLAHVLELETSANPHEAALKRTCLGWGAHEGRC